MSDTDAAPSFDEFDSLLTFSDEAPADEPAEELAADADAPEDDAFDPGDGEEEDAPLAASEAGSEDNPIDLKDLPDDVFVKIKVGGKEEVVSQREHADGIIRQKDFNRRVNEIRDESKRVGEIAQKAQAKVQHYEKSVHSLFSNHEQLDKHLMAHYPEEYEKLAFAYARRYAAEKELPEGERTRIQLDRQKQRHAAQLARERGMREKLESAKRRETEEATLRDALAAPWQEGFTEAGSPALDTATNAKLMGDAEHMFDAFQKREGRMMPHDAIRHMFATLYRNYAPAAEPAPAAKPPAAPRRASRRRARGKKDTRPSEGADGSWNFDHISD